MNLNPGEREILQCLMTANPWRSLRGIERRLGHPIIITDLERLIRLELVQEVKTEGPARTGYEVHREYIRRILYPQPRQELKDRVTPETLRAAMAGGARWAQVSAKLGAPIIDLQALAVEYGLCRKPAPRAAEIRITKQVDQAPRAPMREETITIDTANGNRKTDRRQISRAEIIRLRKRLAAGEGTTKDSKASLATEFGLSIEAVGWHLGQVRKKQLQETAKPENATEGAGSPAVPAPESQPTMAGGPCWAAVSLCDNCLKADVCLKAILSQQRTENFPGAGFLGNATLERMAGIKAVLGIIDCSAYVSTRAGQGGELSA